MTQESPIFDEKGLIPAIVQHYITGKVLMLGYMNKESYAKTLETNHVCFYSRSRQTLWMKGETSGNVLNVSSISLDCDADTLLIKQNRWDRPATRETRAVFFTQVHANDAIPPCDQEILFHLYEIIEGRKRILWRVLTRIICLRRESIKF
jgi:phosphoribosyl-ATP pyrophosphohydrolase/phosphoribosyl-AMP cyclohydrolase